MKMGLNSHSAGSAIRTTSPHFRPRVGTVLGTSGVATMCACKAHDLAFLNDETKTMKLHRNERAVLQSVERREWKSVRGLKHELGRYARYANATLREDRQPRLRENQGRA